MRSVEMIVTKRTQNARTLAVELHQPSPRAPSGYRRQVPRCPAGRPDTTSGERVMTRQLLRAVVFAALLLPSAAHACRDHWYTLIPCATRAQWAEDAYWKAAEEQDRQNLKDAADRAE